MRGLNGKIALVTGAGSGLGEAIAIRLADEGAIVICSDIDEQAGNRVADTLDNAEFVKLDITQEEDWSRVMRHILDQYSAIDVVVNNAGITTLGDIENLSYAAFRHEIDVDLGGAFLGSQAAVRAMGVRGGAIINMSSASGIKASAWLAAYNAAKAAVTLMTKSMALYCGEMKYPIRCNSVHPGAIDTPMIDKAGEQSGDAAAFRQSMIDTHPIGRLGKPEEIAAMVAFLASDEIAFATGAAFVVDGGLTI